MRSLLWLPLALPLFACPRHAGPEEPAAGELRMQANGSTTATFDFDAKTATGTATTDAGKTDAPPTGKLGRDEPCTKDAECARGMVCEGCSDDDKRCVPGCRTDADCPVPEHCNQVHCIRCPCPPLCGP